MEEHPIVKMQRAIRGFGVSFSDAFTPVMRRTRRALLPFTYEGCQELYRESDPGPWLRGDQ